MALKHLLKACKDVLNLEVISYFKSDVYGLKSALIVLDSKFKKQGIKNDISNIVESGIDDIQEIEYYTDMLITELKAHRAYKDVYMQRELYLREKISKLERENAELKINL